MSENAKTRKAVVTTEQVNVALESYRATYGAISGLESPILELDRGPRGGSAFAVYVKGSDTIVNSFDTKEAARDFYANWTAVAVEVLSLQQNRPSESKPEAKTEESKTAPKSPRTAAQKAAA